jgi:hypothetical protein
VTSSDSLDRERSAAGWAINPTILRRPLYIVLFFVFVSEFISVAESESGSGSGIEGDPNLPYPGIAPIALGYLSQTTRPRSWCLALISNPYPLQSTHSFIYRKLIQVGLLQFRSRPVAVGAISLLEAN